MKKGISQLVAILLIAAIAFGCGFGGAYAYNFAVGKGWIAAAGGRSSQSNGNVEISTDGMTADTISINVKEDLTVAEAIAAKAMPSVVGISTVAEPSYSG